MTSHRQGKEYDNGRSDTRDRPRYSDNGRSSSYKPRDTGRRVDYHWMNPEELEVLRKYIDKPGRYIEKEYVFQTPDNRDLPPIDSLFQSPEYTIEELAEIKKKLSDTKTSLDDLHLDTWLSHSNFTSLTGFVVRDLRNKISAEMCSIAWTKMYELAYAYQLCGKEDTKKVRTLHICEAPGGFICSVNHYLRSEHQKGGDLVEWEWQGLSLNPYYEGNSINAMIDDDQFIVHTLKNWNFGPDNTGNIMNQDTIRSVWKDAKKDGTGVTLVTGDGSIDCDWAPNEQESIVANLHYCEAVCALGAVAKGGNVVIKSFTMFEHSTMNLAYLIYLCFRKLIICKPATSKSANSETYIVGKDFQGISPEYLEKLLSFVSETAPPERALFRSEDIPDRFKEQFYTCSKMMSEIQDAVLQRSMSLFKDFRGEKEYIIPEKSRIANEFYSRFKLKSLHKDDRILRHMTLDGRRNNIPGTFNKEKKSYGSLADRKRAREDTINNFSAEKKHKQEQIVVEESRPQTKAEKMMQQMGYKEGEGLGRANDGIIQPIIAEQRTEKSGLGSTRTQSGGNIYRDAVHTSVARNQGGKKFETKDWIVKGRRFEKIMNFRFCMDRSVPETMYSLCKKDDEYTARMSKMELSQTTIEKTLGEKIPFLEAAELDRAYDISKKIRSEKSMNILNMGNSKTSCHVTRYFLVDQDVSGAGFNIENIIRDSNQFQPLEQCDNFLEKAKEKGPYGLIISDSRISEDKRSFQPQEDEVISRHVFMNQTIDALQLLKKDGIFISRLVSTHTRFTVGIVWILSQLFETVGFSRPMISDPLSPDRFLICQKFKEGEKDWAIQHLQKSKEEMNELKDDQERDVLEIVPMPEMNQEFFAFMMTANDDLDKSQLEMLQAEMNSITKLSEDREWIDTLADKLTYK